MVAAQRHDPDLLVRPQPPGGADAVEAQRLIDLRQAFATRGRHLGRHGHVGAALGQVERVGHGGAPFATGFPAGQQVVEENQPFPLTAPGQVDQCLVVGRRHRQLVLVEERPQLGHQLEQHFEVVALADRRLLVERLPDHPHAEPVAVQDGRQGHTLLGPAAGGVAGRVDGRLLVASEIGEDTAEVGLADGPEIGQRLRGQLADRLLLFQDQRHEPVVELGDPPQQRLREPHAAFVPFARGPLHRHNRSVGARTLPVHEHKRSRRGDCPGPVPAPSRGRTMGP
jgi:hypothetical protein